MFAQATKQTTTAVAIPAPMGGINAQDSLMEMPGSDCISMENFTPQTYGLEIRKGYSEWARGFTGPATEIRSLISYEGASSAEDRLFCATVDGIYNVTASGTSYSRVHSWGYPSGYAGDCYYVAHAGLGGRYLLLCDESNGYLLYSEATHLWANAVLTGATTSHLGLAHVSIWKNRVWLVAAGSSDAYYLDTGAIQGNTTVFHFGNKFPNGGTLRSLHSYTHDGGNGPDDYLVALSSSGDVVIYQGTDPSDPDKFGIVGSWNVGSIPAGRNLAATSGGDLYILCGMGLLSVGQLLKGADPGVSPLYITGKVTPLIRSYLAGRRTRRGWFVLSVPPEGILVVGVPDESGTYLQLVMNLATRAWTVYSGLPMRCATVWKELLYLGQPEPSPSYGRVSLYEGYRDGVLLSDPEGSGSAILFSLLTAYRGDEAGASFRRGQFVRPQFLSVGQVSYEAEIRYDFDLRTPAAVSGGAGGALISLWGPPTTWGTALWGGGRPYLVSRLVGGAGMGRYLGVSLSGAATYGGRFLGFTLMLDSGGML